MRKSTIAIIVLVVTLLGSNAWWFYGMIDGAVSYTYLEDSYRTARSTALQALALLPEAAKPDSSQHDLLAFLQKLDPEMQAFEKEGFVVAGSLALRFDSNGRLVEARSNVDPL